MLENNTDRGSWSMITLAFSGIALGLVKVGGTEIGNLILNSIKALFVG
ncbi:hypothetical protein [Paraclostridium bifermentans]|nr:hypothetical protein [Paraclostridium bifermentans]